MATNSPIRSAPTTGRPAGDRPGKHSRCGRVTLVAYTTRLLVGRVFHACLVTMPELTSDHEWCTYAELRGIGIHQLITGSNGDDAVTTARFTWDGQSLASAEA